jgi:hypothetical protein
MILHQSDIDSAYGHMTTLRLPLTIDGRIWRPLKLASQSLERSKLNMGNANVSCVQSKAVSMANKTVFPLCRHFAFAQSVSEKLCAQVRVDSLDRRVARFAA